MFPISVRAFSDHHYLFLAILRLLIDLSCLTLLILRVVLEFLIKFLLNWDFIIISLEAYFNFPID